MTTEAAWASNERASARANEQYNALPISCWVWLKTHACTVCGEQTYDPERFCWGCRRVAA